MLEITLILGYPVAGKAWRFTSRSTLSPTHYQCQLGHPACFWTVGGTREPKETHQAWEEHVCTILEGCERPVLTAMPLFCPITLTVFFKLCMT